MTVVDTTPPAATLPASPTTSDRAELPVGAGPVAAPKIPVSVIIMTKNEESNIAACLDSVRAFDEVFVVDSHSEDQTCAISADRGATVVSFAWNGRYPKKKQWCLENLPFRHQWVLYVDADEQMSPELAEEIRGIIAEGPRYTGYFVGFDAVFFGKALRHGHRTHKLVLFDRSRGRFLDYEDLDVVNMWEVEGHYQPQIDGPVAALKGRMLHKDHKDLFSFFEKLNKYSDWEASLRARGALRHPDQSTLSPVRRLLYRLEPFIPLRGVGIFFYSYLFRLGFLDGRAGFYYAMVFGLYHCIIDAKMYEARCKKGPAP